MADSFAPFDADNHYYEATDAFTRHMDRSMARRCMQWAEVDGKQRLLVGGTVNRFIPNPTFDPVAKPGALDEYFRGRKPGRHLREMFGELDPIDPAYRDRDARLALMDRQGLGGAFFFPTLGVGMEESLRGDPEAAVAAFDAFNRWIDDDWGFAYQNRIFGAPYMTLIDADRAVAQAEWVIERGARIVCMRTAPVVQPGGGTRSPADPIYDRFWATLAEAGVVVAFHAGDAGYGRYLDDWEPAGDMQAFRFSALRSMTSDRAPFDMFAAMVCHGALSRHPNLRLASIESGAEWVAPLLKKLKKAYAQQPWAFDADPVEQFRNQVWVAPFYEDDIRGLADHIGVDRILFGSDYPHAEGLADPVAFVADLKGFSPSEIDQIMVANARELIGIT